MFEDLSIATVNYNTPELVAFMLTSFFKYNNDFNGKIIICDNSTIYNNFNINTSMIHTYKINNDIYKQINKLPIAPINSNNYASAKHAYTIQYIIDNFIKTKYLLLVDSDILFKSSIYDIYNNFIQNNYATYSYIRTKYKIPCIAPWTCLLDTTIFKKIKYFDINRILYVNNNNTHDTGASLYEDCKLNNFIIKEHKNNLYTEHFKGGSVDKNWYSWLLNNQKYWK